MRSKYSQLRLHAAARVMQSLCELFCLTEPTSWLLQQNFEKFHALSCLVMHLLSVVWCYIVCSSVGDWHTLWGYINPSGVATSTNCLSWLPSNCSSGETIMINIIIKCKTIIIYARWASNICFIINHVKFRLLKLLLLSRRGTIGSYFES